ncbi:MAG: glucosaminidase domain-containing protein [Pseudomonadota bacterium]|nr:glucosaminidase domain-containing protein [Pseudomonadota bacterium]
MVLAKQHRYIVAALSFLSLLAIGVFLPKEPAVELKPLYELAHQQIAASSVENVMAQIDGLPNAKKKQRRFFKLLWPYIQEANLNILRERERLLRWQAYPELLDAEQAQLLTLAEKYRVKLPKALKLSSKQGFEHDQESALMYGVTVEDIGDDDTTAIHAMQIEALNKARAEVIETLLKKVDIVPASLTLSQAAIESAWGQSRFAKEGNNLFGVWCYTPGCGVKPLHRAPGDRHEVKRYESLLGSVEDYMLNLNRNRVYRKLRDARFNARDFGEKPLGADMAVGLKRYSALGTRYITMVRSVIKKYRLFELPSF